MLLCLCGLQKNPEELSYYEAFVKNTEVRNKIHVGNLTFNNVSTSKKYLIPVNIIWNNNRIMLFVMYVGHNEINCTTISHDYEQL